MQLARPSLLSIILAIAACAHQAPAPGVERPNRTSETAAETAPLGTPAVPQRPVTAEPEASVRSMLPQHRPASEPTPQASASPAPAVTRALTPEVLIIVLPEADGKVGTVNVESEGETKVLNTAYATAHVANTGAIGTSTLDGAQVRDEFRAALAALPERPASYLVWFVEGQDEPTAESRKELKRILQSIRQRAVPDVTVIGHADAIGGEARNDKLSVQRARKIRDALVKLGIPSDHIRVAGRGAREPLFPTENPGMPEPRNRRVEISVR